MVNANHTGQNSLASYWPLKHWLEKIAYFMLAYLIIYQSYAARYWLDWFFLFFTFSDFYVNFPPPLDVTAIQSKTTCNKSSFFFMMVYWQSQSRIHKIHKNHGEHDNHKHGSGEPARRA